jgi:hypothetical protein
VQIHVEEAYNVSPIAQKQSNIGRHGTLPDAALSAHHKNFSFDPGKLFFDNLVLLKSLHIPRRESAKGFSLFIQCSILSDKKGISPPVSAARFLLKNNASI